MKLFKTSDMRVVAECQELFGFICQASSLLAARGSTLTSLKVIVVHY